MPLVRVVGGRRPEEQIGVYQLAPGPDGRLRQITTGGPPVQVSGEELRKLAGVAQVEVLSSDPPADPVVFDATAGTVQTTPVWSTTPADDADADTTTQTPGEAGEEEHTS